MLVDVVNVNVKIAGVVVLEMQINDVEMVNVQVIINEEKEVLRMDGVVDLVYVMVSMDDVIVLLVDDNAWVVAVNSEQVSSEREHQKGKRMLVVTIPS